MQNQIEYLGFKIDCNSIHMPQNKVDSIVNAKQLQTVTPVKFFLGIVNYYGGFIDN